MNSGLTPDLFQQNESIRLEVTFSKAQWQKLIRMRELLSSSMPNGSGDWNQVLEYVSDRVIQQKDKTIKKEKNSKSQPAVKKGAVFKRSHIPNSIQRAVFQKDHCCQYTDKQTGKQCQSKWKLAIDHIQPVWAGGTNDPANLRILCAAHNQELYRQQAGLSQS